MIPGASIALIDDARAVRFVVFDFDGVFTDNTVYVSQDGVEMVRCWRGDGMGLSALRALGGAGLTWDDIAHVELNEAFAAQSLACLREWPRLDPSKVNPLGGAIAIGHPLGCSGARIVTTLCHQLHRTGGRYGLAAMCIGVGQGIAMVVENVR